MAALSLPRLYPIVDATDAEATRPLALVDALLAAGAPWLQLRCKGIDDGPWLDLAREVVARAARRGARVVVNDRVDIALLAEAAGVHVGQDDLPAADARRLAGPHLVVGVSTHGIDEARRAVADGADYVGFGPMFDTRSKPDASPVRSLDGLRALRAAIALPIVAIGGIDEARAPAVLAAGADAVAMIGALASSPDPAALACRLLAD